MAFDLSKGRHGKKNTVIKVVSKIGEGICYALGFVANLKNKKGVNMADINVENMDENAELFMEKMGFSSRFAGLELTQIN